MCQSMLPANQDSRWLFMGGVLSSLHGCWLACLSLIINPQWTIHILRWVLEGLQNSLGFLEGFAGISRCFQTSLSEPAFLMVPIVLDRGIMWESRGPSRSFRTPFRIRACWRTFLVVPKGVSGIQRAFLRVLEGSEVISINLWFPILGAGAWF